MRDAGGFHVSVSHKIGANDSVHLDRIAEIDVLDDWITCCTNGRRHGEFIGIKDRAQVARLLDAPVDHLGFAALGENDLPRRGTRGSRERANSNKLVVDARYRRQLLDPARRDRVQMLAE